MPGLRVERDAATGLYVPKKPQPGPTAQEAGEQLRSIMQSLEAAERRAVAHGIAQYKRKQRARARSRTARASRKANR